MKQERRRFTREFKLNAVELSYSRPHVVELANELQIGQALQGLILKCLFLF